ncbi:MAG TPA: hypothetical protein VGO67_22250 [Verrucomicrobiae bacterium]|jgi:hypothetical protein
MKKILAISLLAMVSWALAGTPAQATEKTSPTMTLAKNKKHHGKKQQHHKHKKRAKA